MAITHHVLDIYGVHVHLVTNRRDWATLRRRLTFMGDAPTSLGQATFACWEPKGAGKSVPHLVLWINVTDHQGDHLELVDTCAHEATHGVSGIFDWVGHDKAGDEPSAYLTGWLTRWLFEHTQ